MKVRQGWSGEVAPNQWAKVDVELEEEDLRRVLTAAKIPEDARIPTLFAYQLLEIEAECLVTIKLMGRHGFPKDKGDVKIAELVADKKKVLDQIRSGLN